MYGNVSFVNPVLTWKESTVKRNFNILVQNKDGTPAKCIPVHPMDDDGTLIWSGTTDHYGVANFNITYTNHNYTALSRLKIYKGAGKYIDVKDVTFLSETPIIFQLEAFIPPSLFVNIFRNNLPIASNITLFSENRMIVNITGCYWDLHKFKFQHSTI